MLLASFGETLNLQLQGGITSDQVGVDLLAKAPLFEASLAVQTGNGVIAIQSPGWFRWTLTPAAWKGLSDLHPELMGTKLLSPMALQIDLQQFSAPL